MTANQVTVFAVLLSAGAGAAVALRPDEPRVLFVVPALLFVRMALNAIDGVLAREHGMKSDLGAFLNELGDVAADAALYLPLASVPGIRAELMVAFVTAAGVSEMAGVTSQAIGRSRRYDGPMGKSDRALWIGALALALACGAPRGPWIDAAMAAMLLLLAWTVRNRVRRSLEEEKA